MELNFTRKLQLINNCTFISLPKAWIEAKGLVKGDCMCISLLNDGTLRISPSEMD